MREALEPACQPSQATTRTSATNTTALRTRDAPESRASVPLDSPAKARPTTGSTGAPQPTTLHGPVESPSTPAKAPTIPPVRLVDVPQPVTQPCRQRSRASAALLPARREIARKRAPSIA